MWQNLVLKRTKLRRNIQPQFFMPFFWWPIRDEMFGCNFCTLFSANKWSQFGCGISDPNIMTHGCNLVMAYRIQTSRCMIAIRSQTFVNDDRLEIDNLCRNFVVKCKIATESVVAIQSFFCSTLWLTYDRKARLQIFGRKQKVCNRKTIAIKPLWLTLQLTIANFRINKLCDPMTIDPFWPNTISAK